MIKKSVVILGLAALFAAPTPPSFPTLVGSAEALSLSQTIRRRRAGLGKSAVAEASLGTRSGAADVDSGGR